MIENRKIVVGVTGSIAAYKSVEVVRALQKLGAEVRIAMTPSAARFITPLTFETITGYQVFLESVPERGTEIRHTSLSYWGELLIVVPATANTIGKIASGIGDTSVTELALCFGKGILCPAMNVKMLESPITQQNLKKLKNLGWEVVEPEKGYLACKVEGKGRLAKVEDITDSVIYWFTPKLLNDKKVLVTAGATREYIDPVRFISNPSSGKMGIALAKAFKAFGGEVTLIAGKNTPPPPYKVEKVEVETVEEMYREVMKRINDVDIFVSAAAVGDFKPVKKFCQKIKKSKEKLTLELERTVDILKTVGEGKKEGQIVIGFAAETENLLKNAYKKLKEKNLDGIVANDVKKGIFQSDETEVLFIYKGKEISIKGTKEEVAFKIVEELARS